jgi:hypothetical protein
MQHVLSVLLRLVVGQGVPAVAIAVVATSVLVAVFEDARAERRRVAAVGQGFAVELARRELAVFVAAAGFDVRVAVEEALVWGVSGGLLVGGGLLGVVTGWCLVFYGVLVGC